jgi:hypothetical protein
MATYYVATTGTDGAGVSGDITHPWLTVTYAISRISAGDTLYLRGGTYPESVYFNTTGSINSQVLMSGYPGETAIIDGEYTRPNSVGVYTGFLFRLAGVYCTVQNITVTRSNGGLISLTGNHNTLTRVTGISSYASGICDLGSYNIVSFCTMTDNGNHYGLGTPVQATWGSAISIFGDHGRLCYNTSYNNKGEGINCYNDASYSQMDHNLVYDCYSYLIYIDSTNHITANNNFAYCTSSAMSTGAVGITVGNESGHTVSDILIYNNIVYGAYINCKIVTNVSNLTIANNTFLNSYGGGGGYIMGVYVKNYTYTNCLFKNNITIEEDGGRVPISVLNATGWTYSNNCWNKTPSAFVGTGDVVGDAKLRKLPSVFNAGYYELKQGSPCFKAGNTVSGVTTDYSNILRKATPDIGAYELKQFDNNIIPILFHKR